VSPRRNESWGSLSERDWSRRAAVSWFVLLTAFLLWSRLVYAPAFLYFFDNVNFALSIERFDPSAHQPQPPGYPLFVALLKLLNVLFRDPRRDLEAAGLIGSAAGLALVWLWTSHLFGRAAAWIAAALLAANPIFWMAGIVNPVRTFLVVIAAASGALAWNALTGSDPQGWFYLMSAALGFLSGFRPEALALLLPLWAATGIYRKLHFRYWAAGAGLLAVSALTWLVPLVVRIGGVTTTYRFFAEYLRDNSAGYTLAYGASAVAGLGTIRRVVLWNFALALGWIWALPLAWRTLRLTWSKQHTIVLAAAFLPAFLFHALIHVRDVDQTLITIPVVCVIGGAVLANLKPRGVLTAAVSVAVLFSLWNFRRPLLPDLQATSRGAIRYLDDWTRSTFAALDALKSDRAAVWIWDDAVVSWRQVSYYYPKNRLLDLDADPPLWLEQRHSTPATIDNRVVLIPNAPSLVLGVSHEQANLLSTIRGAKRQGPLIILPWSPGDQVQVGNRLLRNPR
jgi:hypothetical protein